jgi:hypothetical protein
VFHSLILLNSGERKERKFASQLAYKHTVKFNNQSAIVINIQL